jgi:hypothetical protein
VESKHKTTTTRSEEEEGVATGASKQIIKFLKHITIKIATAQLILEAEKHSSRNPMFESQSGIQTAANK